MLGVFTAEEMRRLDQRAIAGLGIPGEVLMENAGRGAAQAIIDALPGLGAPRRGAKVVVVCGKGGNGGDGSPIEPPHLLGGEHGEHGYFPVEGGTAWTRKSARMSV